MYVPRPPDVTAPGATTSDEPDTSTDAIALESLEPSPSLARKALAWLLPAPCLACGAEVWRPRGALGLCPGCRARLRRWRDPSCETCGQAEVIGRCETCRLEPPAYQRLLTLWQYEPPLDAVVAGLKFRRLDYLGTQLGKCLAEIHGPRLADCDVAVAMPLHWTRYLRRSYNQATLIARPIAAALGIRLVRPIRRRHSTPPQSRLPRADRLHNLSGVFSIRRSALCHGRHVLLIDDVVTTGATLEAASRCLLSAGASAVTALTVARTPAHGPENPLSSP